MTEEAAVRFAFARTPRRGGRGRWALVGVMLVGCSGRSAASHGATDAGAHDATVIASDGAQADATSSPGDSALPPLDLDAAAGDGGCGYRSSGTLLELDSGIALCLPPVVCTSETCPPTLGSCIDGGCVFNGGYKGLATLPEAWVTYYCTLSTGGCDGVTQMSSAATTASNVADAAGLPLCEGVDSGGECVGIAASSPMVVGNSEEAVNPASGLVVANWGLGLSEASGLCYELHGPGGTAIVALTDRCGGYCKCKGSGFEECGPCVNAPDMVPNCTCVGTDPGLYTACCGNGCATLQSDCDWCASNNHPHFDLDTGTFNHLCASLSSAGSCRLSAARFVPCPAAKTAWPPGGTGASCPVDSFYCTSGTTNQPQIPSTNCCCNWGLSPLPDGGCS